MPDVVNEACIKGKHMDCVALCPVDCFYDGKGAPDKFDRFFSAAPGAPQ